MLYEPEVLSENTLDVSASLGDVASYPTSEHYIGVRVLA
jgi:hypothetical protein